MWFGGRKLRTTDRTSSFKYKIFKWWQKIINIQSFPGLEGLPSFKGLNIWVEIPPQYSPRQLKWLNELGKILKECTI